MNRKKKVITRRDFLRSSAYAALMSSVGFMGSGGERFEGEKKTKVVLIRHPNAIDENNNVNGEVIQSMIDEAVRTLTAKTETLEAWQQLIKADDIVGIKSNSWNYLPTPRELEQAIKKRVMDVGVAESNIDIADRGLLRNPIFLKATALINARPLRTHHWAGIGGCIKNYIQFVPRPSAYHDDSCANLASIWNEKGVKEKTRLNILVVLTPLFHGIGPHHFNRTFVWPYKGMIVSFDPVAADSVGVHLLQAKRRAYFGEDKSFAISPKHVMVAEQKHKLGTANLNNIEIIKLGWKKDILI
jgi:hypothetical protein